MNHYISVMAVMSAVVWAFHGRKYSADEEDFRCTQRGHNKNDLERHLAFNN